MDINQLLRSLGLQQAYQAYQQNIGEPFAAVVGGAGRGYLGLDKPEYGGLLAEETYRMGQAMGNMPGVGAPAGAFKVGMQAAANVPGLLADAMQMMKANPEAGLLAAIGSIKPKSFDVSYRGSHKAPGPDFGAPLYDLTGGGQMYPSDVYSAQAVRYYGTGYPKADKEAFDLARRVRGNPQAEVTMYRAVPNDKNITDINEGDWVTLSKDYAKTHGESVLGGDYKIVQKKVKAKDLWTNADSIHEFGYFPQE